MTTNQPQPITLDEAKRLRARMEEIDNLGSELQRLRNARAQVEHGRKFHIGCWPECGERSGEVDSKLRGADIIALIDSWIALIEQRLRAFGVEIGEEARA
jgi:hypothetical protein